MNDEEMLPEMPPDPTPSEVALSPEEEAAALARANERLLQRRAALAAQQREVAPSPEEEAAALARANEHLLQRRATVGVIEMPRTIGDAVVAVVGNAASVSPEEWKRREAAVRAREATLRQRRVAQNARLRGVPRERHVWGPATDDAAALTVALETVLRGAGWRADRRAECGSRPGHCLVLAGGNGSGKTAAAAWLVARYPGTALFVTADELGEVPDTSWGEHVEVRARWRSVGLLVVDDVGSERAERSKRVVGERLGPLVFRRFNEGLDTILTTNRPSAEFYRDYLATEDPVMGPGGEDDVVLKGTARLASRLRAQLRDGAPYWVNLQVPHDYRSPDGQRALGEMARVDAEGAYKILNRL